MSILPAAASDNGLSIRPAMGWSSWSFVRRWPDETKMKAQADALVSSGLAAHGYVYVNLDDFYQKCDSNGFQVDGFGRWAVDTAKFPGGIKALADYVHAKGLKFGFYVTPGIAKNAVTANKPVEGTSYHAQDIADTSKTAEELQLQEHVPARTTPSPARSCSSTPGRTRWPPGASTT